MGKNSQKSLGFDLDIDPKEHLSLRPIMFAFAAFAATLPLYSPNMKILSGFLRGDDLIAYFVFPMVACALLASLVALVYGIKRRPFQKFSVKFFVGATILYAGGALLFFAAIQLPVAHPLLAAIAGACLGLGSIPLCIAWGTYFAMPLRNALLWCAIVCVVASLMSWGLALLPKQVLWVLYPAIILVGSCTPVFKMTRGEFLFPLPDGAVEELSQEEMKQREDEVKRSEERPVSAFSSLQRLLSIIWLPFTALLLYAFLTSVHRLLLFEMLDSEFLGGALAGLCIIPLCLIKKDKPLLPFVYKIIIPVFVAVLMVLGSFPVDSFPQFLGAIGVYIFCVFLALFAAAMLLAVAYAGEFNTAFIYGFALACGMAVTLLGLIQSQIIVAVENFGPFMWVITCIYFAVILVYLGVSSWKSIAYNEARSDSGTMQENLHIRCASLSQRCNLSEREREILEYLGRGYGPSYIAKTLVISVSTARSHIRNIYRKINVSSKEELLQLIDAEEPEI